MYTPTNTTKVWRIGLFASFLCLLSSTRLLAADATASINGADTAWMIVATALVLV